MAKKKAIVKEIHVKGQPIQALCMPMMDKSLIVLRANKGYVMCGYLNMSVANKFKEAAIKVTGVATIEETLQARVHSCSTAAARLGIRKGQPIVKALALLA